MTFRTSVDAGFTLFEVIVALVIAMLALSAMLALTMPARQSAGLSKQFIEATRHARSHLAAIGTETLLTPGDMSGTDEDGFVWHATVTALESHVVPVTDKSQVTLGLFGIEVIEKWNFGQKAHSVVLRTKKLQAEKAAPG